MKKTLSLIVLASLMPLDSRGDASGPVMPDDARRALLKAMAAHPKIVVEKLTELDWKRATAERIRRDPAARGTHLYAISLRCHVGGEEVAEMVRFRKDLKGDRRIQALFPTHCFDVEWRISGGEDPDDDHRVHFTLFLFGPVRP